MKNSTPHVYKRPLTLTGQMRQFNKDEDGSIIIFTLILFVIVLVLGGMAVDFMRFESRRAQLQSVADRAVLAAAQLNQTIAPDQVVIDFFEKAGYENAIIGQPTVSGNATNRSVGVNAAVDIDTYYLRLIGMDQLSAPANAIATEGAGDVEISLVLDISGSMGENGGVTDKTRLDLLKEAATNFNNTLLVPDYQNQISISLVAYSAHVNVGDHIFSRISTEPSILYDTSVWQAQEIDATDPDAVFAPPNPTQYIDVVPPTAQELLDMQTAGLDISTVIYSRHENISRCVDMSEDAFNSTTFDFTEEFRQVENYDPYGSADVDGPVRPICPSETFEAIIPLTQTASVLNTAINSFEPRTTTSIHDGMKWGVTLVDPSFRDILATHPSTDPYFANKRPADYVGANDAPPTVKYVVLMTDGSNFQGYRLKRDETDADDRSYQSVLHRNYWDTHSYQNWSDTHSSVTLFPNYTFETVGVSVSDKDDRLQAICQAAKDQNITIFTIAMNAPTAGEEEMRDCASSTAHYFETEGAAINDVFEKIAEQITYLRLSL